jgi:hypothetical protein
VLAEGFFGPLGAGACDALVDDQCLLQEGGGFAGVAVVEVGPADSFQGAGFLQGQDVLAGSTSLSAIGSPVVTPVPGGKSGVVAAC